MKYNRYNDGTTLYYESVDNQIKIIRQHFRQYSIYIKRNGNWCFITYENTLGASKIKAEKWLELMKR